MEILRSALRDPEGYLAELGDDFDALYAVALLAHLREPAAHDLLVDLSRLPTEQFEPLIGGFITEGMERALFATCDGRTERIRELLLDPGADAYLRSQAADALVMAVHQGWAERGEVLDFLAAQLVPEVADLEGYFWTGICSAMLRLHPVEHLDALLRAWDEGLIEPLPGFPPAGAGGSREGAGAAVRACEASPPVARISPGRRAAAGPSRRIRPLAARPRPVEPASASSSAGRARGSQASPRSLRST